MSIPSSAAPFFQEYDFAGLDPREHVALIIERILAYGSRAEMRWLVDTYGWDTVRAWIADSGARRLPRARRPLICLIFDLPVPQGPTAAWPH